MRLLSDYLDLFATPERALLCVSLLRAGPHPSLGAWLVSRLRRVRHFFASMGVFWFSHVA